MTTTVTIDRARAERFGAWVRLADATLVAVDRARAKRLGIEGGSLWSEPSRGLDEAPVAPLEAHVAVTARCPATCSGCYLDARADGAHATFEQLVERLEGLASRGVFTVAFGGGEPLTHPAIGALATRARALGMTPVVTTSGLGLTREKALTLRDFAQVNVSYDGARDGYEQVRGFDGRRPAERAIALLTELGMRVGINVVLTRESFGTGDALVDTCARARTLGAIEVQLLRYKPAGRAASLDYLDKRLTGEQVATLPNVVARLPEPPSFSVRIDCAMVALLSPMFEADGGVEALHALGVMGCEAGRALVAVKVGGGSAPCSFLADGPDLAAVVAYADSPAEPCNSCPIRAVCRGGCRVVAGHLGPTPFAPDPECPRVVADRRARTRA